jgi:hypothetical protein
MPTPPLASVANRTRSADIPILRAPLPSTIEYTIDPLIKASDQCRPRVPESDPRRPRPASGRVTYVRGARFLPTGPAIDETSHGSRCRNIRCAYPRKRTTVISKRSAGGHSPRTRCNLAASSLSVDGERFFGGHLIHSRTAIGPGLSSRSRRLTQESRSAAGTTSSTRPTSVRSTASTARRTWLSISRPRDIRTVFCCWRSCPRQGLLRPSARSYESRPLECSSSLDHGMG